MTSQTTCPICHTIFRIAELSLSSSKGMVQCGVCGMVFDALQNAEHVNENQLNEEQTDPDLTTNQTPVSIPTPEDKPADIPKFELFEEDQNTPALKAAEDTDLDDDAELTTEEMPVIHFKQTHTRQHKILWSISIFILIIAFVIQIATLYRDKLAATFPILSPLFVNLCDLAQCQITLPRDKNLIKVTNTTFEADTKNPHLLYVNIGMENQADIAIDYPAISLSLTNDDDTIVIVRNFKPVDYGLAPDKIARGIKPHAEMTAKLTLEIKDVAVSGYKIIIFYTP